MMPACIVTTFLCPALVLPCGFLEAELQTWALGSVSV